MSNASMGAALSALGQSIPRISQPIIAGIQGKREQDRQEIQDVKDEEMRQIKIEAAKRKGTMEDLQIGEAEMKAAVKQRSLEAFNQF
jgi:hypothetical protein